MTRTEKKQKTKTKNQLTHKDSEIRMFPVLRRVLPIANSFLNEMEFLSIFFYSDRNFRYAFVILEFD